MGIKDEINRIEAPPAASNKLDTTRNPAAIRSKTGLARPRGGGIASPLVETDYVARTWHPAKTLTSTDGVFTFSVRFIKSIGLTDANGDAVSIEYKDKP